MTNRRRTVPLMLALALALTSCNSGARDAEAPTQDGETTQSTEGEAPSSAETLTVALGATAPRGLDPAVINNFTPSGEGNYLPAIYGMLVYLDAYTGDVVPQLAESLTPNEDGSVWTLVLRPGLVFSDGTPLDAEAVLKNYERHQDPDVSSRLAGTVRDMTFEAVDATTLEMTLPSPNLYFDKTLAVSLPYIGSPTAMERDPEGFGRSPVGAGPYVVEEIVDDSHVSLKRNETYFDSSAEYPDNLVFRVIPDPQQRIQAVVAGEAQIAVPGSDMSLLDAGVEQGLTAKSVQLSGGTFFIFNTAQEPFDDPMARQAVTAALNPQTIVDIADGGSEALGISSLFAENSPFYDPNRLFTSDDQARAQQLLDDIASAGEPLSFTLALPQGGQWRRYGESVQSTLSALDNINVQVDFMENAALASLVFNDRNFQMSGFNVFMPDPEPNLFNFVHSAGRDNNAQFSDPALDAAIEASRTAASEAERAAALAEVESILIEEVPVWPLKGANPYLLHGEGVSGLTMHSEGSLLWSEVRLAG